ncbi:MAG TPA: hypothetical protein ENK32_11895 [Anaerolineae bacterium]|nr:hypothetical protein [Anaerolineae bacterium]
MVDTTLTTSLTLTELETAVWRTIAYADGFDYPMTAVEIHRYLEGLPASLADVQNVLTNNRQQPGFTNYHTLPGRDGIIKIRRQRERRARQLWPHAAHYARLIARIPFVRMVAVTGSLAMNNAAPDADVDYLIVTEHGRLWLCRALIIGVVKLAARQGVILCPNYILSENALQFPEQNLYTARELCQMVPLSGLTVYWKMRRLNEWTDRFLPNAAGLPPTAVPPQPAHSRLQTWAELPLRTAVGGWLERWEMNRKIRKLETAVPAPNEARFTANQCKGHFQMHQRRAIRSYQEKALRDA